MQVAKACNDMSFIYAKIVMFFIKSVENDLKNFRSGNCFSFFTILQNFCVLQSAKFIYFLRKCILQIFP